MAYVKLVKITTACDSYGTEIDFLKVFVVQDLVLGTYKRVKIGSNLYKFFSIG